MPPTKERVEEVRDALNEQLRAAGDTWAPTYRRIYGVPPILPGECASSWIWRIAANTRVPINRVLTSLGVEISSFWLDSGAAQLEIEGVATTTMTQAGTLSHLCWPASSVLAQPEFACWTTDPVRKRPIYRYCEQCLGGDPLAYFRQYWRLASSYICERHGSILRDACWRCQTPIDLSRAEAPALGKFNSTLRTLRRCSHCAEDLAAIESQYFPQQILSSVFALQMELKHLISRTVASELPVVLLTTPNGPGINRRTGEQLDMSSSGNVLSLLGSLLIPLLAHKYDDLAPEACVTQLRRWLRRALVDTNGQEDTFPIGLDGVSLFGRHAGLVGSHVFACQQITGGTYWWRTGAGLGLPDPTDFTAPAILAGMRWVNSRSPSKPINTA
ncbi:TniQ family protein [Pandoraea sputorum]|uniref:TniQ family protein n=1 Tax=Pandoraea sputorum TaxID=93222 RepID=UPI003969F5CB